MNGSHLTNSERASLLALARNAILRSLGMSADVPEIGERLTTEKRGAFVTLRQGSELRGCIGYVEPIETIADAVRQLAVKAACEDPRFASVHSSEVSTLSIEVSVLTPLQPVGGPQDIVIGKHGAVVEQGWNRGLLLPEVASDAGWDASAFLDHCCRKAGLASHAWKESETKIYVFETEHFSDSTQAVDGEGS